MSDGHVHDLHGVAAAALVAICTGVLSLFGGPVWAWGLPAGVVFGTLFLSPDLDMWKTGPNRRWGMLRFLWLPYAWAFKHRGVSHSWLVGPLTRLVYLTVLLAAVFWPLTTFTAVAVNDLRGLAPWGAAAAAGVVLANWVHLLGDR